MGGGAEAGFMPIVKDFIFKPLANGLVGAAIGSLTQNARPSSSGLDQAAIEAQAAERAAAQQAEQNAELRRREQRQQKQAELLAQAHTRELAAQADKNAQAQTLGAPAVATSNLKEKLGQ